ncbi:MAG: ferredoxin--NADP reductase [Candidatus Nitrosopumilus limneticus]|nr:Ferredoxin--NADP reductase [Candidatus Nitrosopumilus limneticus]MDC4211833.1 ferredoxin--NADP reductase [Candidatus Nitrosopumilus limneticus]MDC4213647.1 ferredoxin--NADP reductase [Candidatus Nitrosopumilus limneticus]MDC4214346.1 ferredoxin--NADP reductase [Candidatus Nitrosopumilus limneticus]MDC4216307.1 ferredoxin--NADP reductase [Candidatus Nitrosopumilus limneticus]
MVVDNKATVTYVQLLKEDLLIMRIVPNEGPVPDFEAGQFLTLGLPNPLDNGKIVRRAYSIASHPENKEYIEFVIRWVRKPLPGRLTTQLFSAKEGDEILWLKPTGRALGISEVLPKGEKDTRRMICIGGGTGLAPFVSFAQHLHDTNDKREIIILHGASYVDELSYKDLLTGLENESIDKGKDKWNFKYRAAISRPQEWFNRSWSGQVGRVETFLRPRDNGLSALEELIGDKITQQNTIFYVCGWQGTIDGVMDFLNPKGFVTEQDKREDGSFEVKYESYG